MRNPGICKYLFTLAYCLLFLQQLWPMDWQLLQPLITVAPHTISDYLVTEIPIIYIHYWEHDDGCCTLTRNQLESALELTNWWRVDNFLFLDCSSPFCFLIIEFHCTLSKSYKILPYYVYYYWLASDMPPLLFFHARFTSSILMDLFVFWKYIYIYILKYILKNALPCGALEGEDKISPRKPLLIFFLKLRSIYIFKLVHVRTTLLHTFCFSCGLHLSSDLMCNVQLFAIYHLN